MRVVRINELIKREISDILHTRYRDTSVRITISGVDTAPNLKAAKVFYGVIGEQAERDIAKHFFTRENREIRSELSKRIVLKFLPHLYFEFDNALERGARLNDIIDALGIEPDEPDESEEQ